MKEYAAADGSKIYVLSDETVRTDREEAIIAQKLIDGDSDIEQFLNHMNYHGRGQRTRAERIVRDYVEWSATKGVELPEPQELDDLPQNTLHDA